MLAPVGVSYGGHGKGGSRKTRSMRQAPYSSVVTLSTTTPAVATRYAVGEPVQGGDPSLVVLSIHVIADAPYLPGDLIEIVLVHSMVFDLVRSIVQDPHEVDLFGRLVTNLPLVGAAKTDAERNAALERLYEGILPDDRPRLSELTKQLQKLEVDAHQKKLPPQLVQRGKIVQLPLSYQSFESIVSMGQAAQESAVHLSRESSLRDQEIAELAEEAAAVAAGGSEEAPANEQQPEVPLS